MLHTLFVVAYVSSTHVHALKLSAYVQIHVFARPHTYALYNSKHENMSTSSVTSDVGVFWGKGNSETLALRLKHTSPSRLSKHRFGINERPLKKWSARWKPYV